MSADQHHPIPDVRLSERLSQVAGLVPECRRLIDIGTDHGYLPIHLVREQRCHQAVAADIRPGPLGRAASHIRALGLSDQIETCLTNGLQGMMVMAEDVIVIAGLGGNEIRDILAASLPDCRAIILQPMKSAPDLRLWLYQNGYTIDAERLAIDRGRYYPIMRCVWTGFSQKLDLLDAWVGPVLLRDRPANLPSWLEILHRRLDKHGRSQPELRALADRIAGLLDESRAERQPG